METLAIVIFKNQNEVSKKEAEKIRCLIKKEYPGMRMRTIRNKKYSEVLDIIDKNSYEYVLYYNTYDRNGKVKAELIWEISNIGTNNTLIEI